LHLFTGTFSLRDGTSSDEEEEERRRCNDDDEEEEEEEEEEEDAMPNKPDSIGDGDLDNLGRGHDVEPYRELTVEEFDAQLAGGGDEGR